MILNKSPAFSGPRDLMCPLRMAGYTPRLLCSLTLNYILIGVSFESKFKSRKINRVVTQEERVLGTCEGIRDPVQVPSPGSDLLKGTRAPGHSPPHATPSSLRMSLALLASHFSNK